MARGTVKVTWTPEPQEVTVIDMNTIRIEIDEDQPERVWIWMIENGEKVEGGSFSMNEFMDMVLEFYNENL